MSDLLCLPVDALSLYKMREMKRGSRIAEYISYQLVRANLYR